MLRMDVYFLGRLMALPSIKLNDQIDHSKNLNIHSEIKTWEKLDKTINKLK